MRRISVAPALSFQRGATFIVCVICLRLMQLFHPTLISALKTEPKTKVFEKSAKNRKIYLSLFSIFVNFPEVSSKNSQYQLNHVS